MNIYGQVPHSIIQNFQQAIDTCTPYLLDNGGTIPAIALGIITRNGDAITHSMGIQDIDKKIPLE